MDSVLYRAYQPGPGWTCEQIATAPGGVACFCVWQQSSGKRLAFVIGNNGTEGQKDIIVYYEP